VIHKEHFRDAIASGLPESAGEQDARSGILGDAEPERGVKLAGDWVAEGCV